MRTVVYQDCSEEQVRWGSCADPRGVLVTGESYQVERMDVHSWHTKVYLVGHEGGFNSCCFEDAEPSKEETDAFWIRKTGRPKPAQATAEGGGKP